MSITRGEFLKSLGKSLPGLVASTGVATAAETLFRRLAQAAPESIPSTAKADSISIAGERVIFHTRGPADAPGLALTFDDGPIPGITEKLLDTLRAHGARATFFLIGQRVAAAPELARQIVAEGHEVGHHTYSHRKATEMSRSDLENELERSRAVLTEVSGVAPGWFRPPFGALRQDQAQLVQQDGMRVALWSVDAEDWRTVDVDSVVKRVRQQATRGSIVLLHETETSTRALPEMLRAFRDDVGLESLRLSDMIPPSHFAPAHSS